MPHGLCSFKTEETISCSSTYYQLSQVSFRKTPQSHSHYPSTTTPILHAKHLWSSVTSTDLFQSPTIPHTHTTRRRAYSPQSRPLLAFSLLFQHSASCTRYEHSLTSTNNNIHMLITIQCSLSIFGKQTTPCGCSEAGLAKQPTAITKSDLATFMTFVNYPCKHQSLHTWTTPSSKYVAALSEIKSARFSPTLQLAMWNISGAHSHKSNYSYNNFLTVSISPDTLTTDLFLSTNHNNIMQASGTFSQTLSMNLRFSLNKNQTYPFLAAQSTLIVRPYPTYNQPTLGNSNLLLQQHQSNTNYQQHSAGFAWLLDTATHVNKQKMMLSP